MPRSPGTCGPTRRSLASPATVPSARRRPSARLAQDQVEKAERNAARSPRQATPAKAVTGEPLSNLQWDMQDDRRHRRPAPTPSNQGSKGVLVGIIDTGIDGTHPDIAPELQRRRSAATSSRDIPDIDGPCEHPVCVDPANDDDDGHGTHVAGTIGVADQRPRHRRCRPERHAGQHPGRPGLGLLLPAARPSTPSTYAGDIGIDVVNMSFYIDPWLFNCADNPADTPGRAGRAATIIARPPSGPCNYARRHGVTLVAAEGNEHTDLGNPTVDDTSPDFPLDTAASAHGRQLLPRPCRRRRDGVIGASAPSARATRRPTTPTTAPSRPTSRPRVAYYRDFFGTRQHRVTRAT